MSDMEVSDWESDDALPLTYKRDSLDYQPLVSYGDLPGTSGVIQHQSQGNNDLPPDNNSSSDQDSDWDLPLRRQIMELDNLPISPDKVIEQNPKKTSKNHEKKKNKKRGKTTKKNRPSDGESGVEQVELPPRFAQEVENDQAQAPEIDPPENRRPENENGNDFFDSEDDLPLRDNLNAAQENENFDDDDDFPPPPLDRNNGEWTLNVSDHIRVKDFREPVGPTQILPAESEEMDFFLQLFPEEFFENIAVETNRYANEQQRKADKIDCVWYVTTAQEIKAYIGLLIAMSIAELPSKKMYWSQDWLFSMPAFRLIMTRTRFDKLNQYFHVNDTAQNPRRGSQGHDPICHIRPLHDRVGVKCIESYNPNKEHSIDEAMIAFKGRLSYKQYLPAKPTKFGIKVWERADARNGFVLEFQVYTGKKPEIDGSRTSEIGLGARVVKDLTEKITGKNYHVYMDNFFTGIPLFEDLLANGIYACGTIRTNRKGWPAALHPKLLKNQGESVVMQRGANLTATAWQDKRQVNFLATNSNPSENVVIERHLKTGQAVTVPAPIAVRNYQSFMAGVDRADQLRMQYSCSRKARKFWKYLFAFLLDTCISNSYILYKLSPNHVKRSKNGRVLVPEQVNFRSALAKQLIGDFRATRKRSHSNIDGSGLCHWPIKMRKRRCKQCCRKNRRSEVTTGYEQCTVNLCLDCFKPFHREVLGM